LHCVRQAIADGIVTYLIDSEKAVPRRLGQGDGSLECVANSGQTH